MSSPARVFTSLTAMIEVTVAPADGGGSSCTYRQLPTGLVLGVETSIRPPGRQAQYFTDIGWDEKQEDCHG